MKWLTLSLVSLSTLCFVAVMGLSVLTLAVGIVGGLVASFAVAAYLQTVRRDYPVQYYENEQVKYQSSFSAW